MKNRTIVLRLSLDYVGAETDTMTDDERGQWLRGLVAGARGVPPFDNQPEPWQRGWKAGAEALARAVAYEIAEQEEEAVESVIRTQVQERPPFTF